MWPLGFAVGAAWFLLPSLLETELRTRLVDAAQRRGLTLVVGEIWLNPLEGVTLDNVSLRLDDGAVAPAPPAVSGSQAKPLLDVERISVRWEVSGVTAPRLYLHRVDVFGGTMRVHRAADGTINLRNLAEQMLATGPDDGEAKGGRGGGLRRFLSDHVPEIHGRGLHLEIDDDTGAPLMAKKGVDLRHLRLTDASIDLRDLSPVRERAELEVTMETAIAGFTQKVVVSAKLALPERSGSLVVTIPAGLHLDLAGYRGSIAAVELDSNLELVLRDLSIDRIDGGAPLSLGIRRIIAQLTVVPRPLAALPPALRDRLPAAALLALRHIAEIQIEDPEFIGTRAASAGKPGPDERDGAEPGQDAALLPKVSRKPDGESRSKSPAPKQRNGEPKPAGAGPAQGKAASRSRSAAGDANAAPMAPGQKIREALQALLTRSSDKLEGALAQLKTSLAAMPFDQIRLVRGRARYRDERPRAGGASEVSDFSARLQRKPAGIVEIEVAFDTPGGEAGATNKIAGRVDTNTGDAHLQIRLDRLPLAPYGALLPAALRSHDDSVVTAKRLDIRYDAKARSATVEGSVETTHVDVFAPRIARHVIADLSLRASGKIGVDLAGARAVLEQGELAVGKVVALVEGSCSHIRTAPRFDMTIKVPSLNCQDAVDSMVGPLAPLLAGAKCDGSMSFRIAVGLDTADMSSLQFEFEPALRGIQIHSLGDYIDFDVLRGPFEHHARQRDGSLYSFVTGPTSARWVPMSEIADAMMLVVTTTEDGSFFWHKGFSLPQIRDAMVSNLQKGRFHRGASTISQQVVKNLFFVEREKTVSRKLQEAVVTWEMEHRLSKQEILELYFNIIEFGPLIYGIRAATLQYFNRPPSDLTLLQAIWIGSIIPNPRAFFHQFTKGGVSESWQKTLCWIADVMVRREKITAEQRARLGQCEVVFGGSPDGSEAPPDLGLGFEAEHALEEAPPELSPLDPSAPLPPPTATGKPLLPATPALEAVKPGASATKQPAPSVDVEDQP